MSSGTGRVVTGRPNDVISLAEVGWLEGIVNEAVPSGLETAEWVAVREVGLCARFFRWVTALRPVGQSGRPPQDELLGTPAVPGGPHERSGGSDG